MKFKRIMVLSLAAVMLSSLLTGCSIFRSEKAEDESLKSTNDSSKLMSGQYYIWHDESQSNIESDIGTDLARFKKYTYDIFRPVYSEAPLNSNLDVGNSYRVMMMLADNDYNIPTYYKGDELIYCSENALPSQFALERFYDHGYSFGLSGLTEYIAGSENYVLNTNNADCITCKAGSTAEKLAQALSTEGTIISIPSVGEKNINASDISKAGTIKGLLLNSEYDTAVYIGTTRYMLKLKADTRIFSSYEQAFTTNDYSFVGKNVVKIKLPDYLKSGYYNINGAGLFRYVSEGTSYDNTTDFNDPIIIKDDEGKIIYNPVPYDASEKTKTNNTDVINSSGAVSSIKKSITAASTDTVKLNLTFSGVIDVTRASKIKIKYYRTQNEIAQSATGATVSGEAEAGTEKNPYVIIATNEELAAGNLSRDVTKLPNGNWVFEITGLENYQKHTENITLVRNTSAESNTMGAN